MRRTSLSTLVIFAALMTVVSPAAAQSLFGTRGLGLPVAPVDARGRALGGVPTGLLGLSASLVNPADAAGTLRRGAALAFQPAVQNVELDGLSERLGATTFPLIRVVLPLRQDLVLYGGYGSYLDQSFGLVSEGTESIGGETVSVRDELSSSGGIARAQVGLAYSIGESLAIGVAGAYHTGELQRELRRVFTDSASEFGAFNELRRWQYSGPAASVGVRVDLGSAARLGASATWSADVEIDPITAGAQGSTIPMPLEFAAGASAVLSTDLVAALGGTWKGWGDASGARLPWLAGDQVLIAGDSWELGGGLEWTGFGSDARAFPVRLGGQYAKLPFGFPGTEAPTEWSAGLGFGLSFDETPIGPGALADLSLETGRRSGAGTFDLTESFWRFTASLALFGR